MRRSHLKHLFVYGSLLHAATGHRAVDVLLRRDVRDAGAASIAGRLFDLGRYPGALKARDGARVHGRLLYVKRPRHVLRVLDRYEDYRVRRPQASEFLRASVNALLADGGVRAAWVYWYNGRLRGRRLPSGRYDGHRGQSTRRLRPR